MSEIPIHLKKLAENNRNVVARLGGIDETSKSANLAMKIASLASSFAIGDAYLRGIISENESSLNLPIDPEFDQFFEENQNIGMSRMCFFVQ